MGLPPISVIFFLIKFHDFFRKILILASVDFFFSENAMLDQA